MRILSESITQEFSPYIGETSPEKVLSLISRISHHPLVVSSHRQWEEMDREWKQSTKNNDDDIDIMRHAALVRESKKAKDHIHDAAATMARKIAESSGVLVDFQHSTLGEATKAGSTPELSVEWLNLRKKGIGGSSVSKVLGFHWKSRIGNPVYMDEQEYLDTIVDMSIDKMTPATTSENPSSGVLYRGHQWEVATLVWLSLTYNLTIAVSKDTWKGKRDTQIINVDGIVVDDNGKATGIVECKTSSREWTWENGVPVNYRAQVLWYLNATGLDHAYVIVRFDSGDMEVYEIRSDETVDGTSLTRPIYSSAYSRAISDTWDSIAFYRDNPEVVWEDSSRLRRESNSIERGSVVTNSRGLTPYGKKKLHGAVVIHGTFCAPYERMDDRFTVMSSVYIDQELFRGTEPLFPVYPMEYAMDDSIPDIDEDSVRDKIGESFVVASDEETYRWVTSIIGKEDVVNGSAVRRWITRNPGEDDFRSVEAVLSWIDNVCDNAD